MGLSLSVLAALAIILPGAAFVVALSRLASPTTPTTLIDQHVGVGLALVVASSILLHAVWIALWQCIGEWAGFPTPNVGFALAVLSGDIGSATTLRAIGSLNKFPVWSALYFLSLVVVGWLAGRSLNRSLKPRNSASWVDLLRPGGSVTFVWLTTDLNIGHQTYLYAGVLREFSVARDGRLERVVLEHSVRKKMDHSRAPMPEQQDLELAPDPTVYDGWTTIAGEFCVLQMHGANTINVDYHYDD